MLTCSSPTVKARFSEEFICHLDSETNFQKNSSKPTPLKTSISADWEARLSEESPRQTFGCILENLQGWFSTRWLATSLQLEWHFYFITPLRFPPIATTSMHVWGDSCGERRVSFGVSKSQPVFPIVLESWGLCLWPKTFLSPQDKFLLVRFPTVKENQSITHEAGAQVIGFQGSRNGRKHCWSIDKPTSVCS